MEDEQAQVLAGEGNVAVVALQGRTFPGIHVQGDTFAASRREAAGAASRLRRAGGDGAALDDLEYAVQEMNQLLRFCETVLTERGIRCPYLREEAG